MTVNVTEYMNKIQEEGLATLKQAQDANLAALASIREFTANSTEKPGEMPAFTNVPTPAQFIERSFDFTNQLLEMRKAYTLKVAEMFVDAQKLMFAEAQKATEQVQKATVNVSKAATNVTTK